MSNIDHIGRAAFVGALATLAMVQTAPALAESESPLRFSVSQSVSHDSNIFGRAKSSMPAGMKLSDTIYTTQAGISFDKEYSRQGLHAGFSVGRRFYHR